MILSLICLMLKNYYKGADFKYAPGGINFKYTTDIYEGINAYNFIKANKEKSTQGCSRLAN